MENAQIAEIFDEMADLLDLKEENAFRIRSYRNAARTIRDMSGRLEDLVEEGKALSDYPSIGQSHEEKIREILHRGTCERLEDLRGEVPEELVEIMSVPQLGPRKAMQLHKELGVGSLEDLREACEAHRVRDLEGMGAKTEQNILKGLRTLESGRGRFLYRTAEEFVAAIERHLEGLPAVGRWEVAGSFRRRKETVGDLDILVQARDRSRAADGILDFQEVQDVLSRGEEKVSVRLRSGIQVDYRFFEPEAIGSALLYFTGSKDHNIALRRRVQARGWKLNEYGLFQGDHALAGKTEKAVFHRLDLPWIPPELREDRGELEAAEQDRLPKLLEEKHVRGDLQCHTTASDGTASIREMAEGARDRGHAYLAITDHSRAVTVANGLDEDRLREHADRIRQVDASMKRFRLLAGVEVDILKTGKLDLDEKVLEGLDWVMASVHYHRNLGKKEMTDRVTAAIKSGVVHSLAHPTGRIIGRRDPIELDMDRVIEACLEHGVCLEINAQPDRLDLPEIDAQRAMEAGVALTISTDAHKVEDLDFMRYGVGVARRAWVGRTDVLNTVAASTLLKRIRGRGSGKH